VRSSQLYQELAREKEELAARLTETHRELARLNRSTPADLRKTPRWAWPLDCLLADKGWWQAWLPSLYQLLGSEAPGRGGASEDTGYVDLLSYLFPPIGATTWCSPEYGTLARSTAPAQGSGLPSGPGRARSWEPVVRHAALALAALEATEDPDADAYHAMRVQAEITGPWVSFLRHLLGRSPAELGELPIWTVRLVLHGTSGPGDEPNDEDPLSHFSTDMRWVSAMRCTQPGEGIGKTTGSPATPRAGTDQARSVSSASAFSRGRVPRISRMPWISRSRRPAMMVAAIAPNRTISSVSRRNSSTMPSNRSASGVVRSRSKSPRSSTSSRLAPIRSTRSCTMLAGAPVIARSASAAGSGAFGPALVSQP
jgi:hypothetical protein